jgi:DNA repair protein RecO (recombination protein O)
MHNLIKTEAIVIREKEMGDYDKLFFLYTKKFGKIEVLAKAIRRPRAKLRGGLQVFNHIFLEFVQGKNFNIVTDAMVIDSFENIKKSPKQYRCALSLCEILYNLTNGQEADERIWMLLYETLCKINNFGNKKNDWLIPRYFEWNLASLLGFEPELYYCLNCREKISNGKIFFSSKNGGLVCEKCSSADIKGAESIEISRDAIKILRLIIHRDKNILNKIAVFQEHEQELKHISLNFLQYILEEKVFVI